MIKQGLFILISGLILIFNLYPRPVIIDKKIVADQREIKITKMEIERWEKITINYPNYRDGYLKLANLYWKLFDEDKTNYFLEQVRRVDPNSETLNKISNLVTQ